MASKHSDRDLRRQALFLTDPYDQPDLAWTNDPANPVIDLLNIYRYDQWPTKKVFCVQCQGHHHQHGFTCIRTDGMRVLVGSDCGEEVLGESWAEAERRLKGKVTRKYELEMYDRLSPIITPMRQALATWEQPLQQLAFLVIGFKQQLGEIWSRAEEAASRYDGRLVIAKRTKRASGREPEFVQVRWGQLRGAALFEGFARLNVVNAVEETHRALDLVAKVLPSTDVVGTQTMTGRRMRLERAFANLERVHAAYEGGQEFFTPETFRQLVEWSWALGTHDRYAYQNGRIDFADGRYGIAAPAKPLRDLDDTPLDLIREYRRAD